MDPEIDKLRRDLKRYRYLLSNIDDPRASAVLRNLIEEAQLRLRQLEATSPTANGTS